MNRPETRAGSVSDRSTQSIHADNGSGGAAKSTTEPPFEPAIGGSSELPLETANQLSSGSSHKGPLDHDYFLWPPTPAQDETLGCITQPPPVVPHQTRLAATWLAGDGDRLGMTDVDIRETLAFPSAQGFTLTPGLGLHLLDGPSRTDLPPRLYDAYLQIGWQKQHSPRFAYQLSVTPSVYSDFDNDSSDAVRILGRALGFYDWRPATQLVFGVVYLDREDVRLLPAFGFIWTPRETTRWEIVFPKPRLAWRFDERENRERWVYLAGEFGGGSWAVQRVSGVDDVATYSDWRLIGGLEFKYQGGPSLRFEVGYVFNRDLEYQSGIGDFEPEETVMLRAGVTF